MGPADHDKERPPFSGGWGSLSRRSFLRRGTVTAAAVGVVASVPGLSGLLVSATADAPAAESAANEAEADAGALSQPLLAQVKDLNTGEISLFAGEREIVIRNPAVARSLFAAIRP
jgi:hypothetical protein